MRGADAYNEVLFSTVRLEDLVPVNHPLRPIRKWVNGTLAKMDTRFSAMYEADIKGGRPSIAPEKRKPWPTPMGRNSPAGTPNSRPATCHPT